MLIDLFATDLVAGYKELNIAREALMQKWRFELLRGYTNKYNAYTQQLARQEARRAQYQRFLPFIGVALFFVCAVGAWMTFRSVDLACFGMLLMLGAGFGALLTLVPFMISRTPQPPENPVTRTSNAEDESPLRQKLFPELVPLWRQELALPVPSIEAVERMAAQTGRWGLVGEFDLIRGLEQVVSPDTYILHGLTTNAGDDMDVVVIGPKGFWYFEVKHWNAHFVWHEGVWQIWQFDYTSQSPQLVVMKEYPDAQWSRIRNELLASLKASKGSAADLLKKAPVIGNIQGGIVFSNPNAIVEIERTAPFRYATIEQWIAAYQAAPRLKDMTPERTLQLLEFLLKRHQSFYPDAPLHSMKEAIAKVIAGVEEGVQRWIES